MSTRIRSYESSSLSAWSACDRACQLLTSSKKNICAEAQSRCLHEDLLRHYTLTTHVGKKTAFYLVGTARIFGLGVELLQLLVPIASLLHASTLQASAVLGPVGGGRKGDRCTTHKEEGGKQHHPKEEEGAPPPKEGGKVATHTLGGATFLLLLWLVLLFPLLFGWRGVPLFFLVLVPFCSLAKKLIYIISITGLKCIKKKRNMQNRKVK